MGKGDKKTRRGKIKMGSYGVKRLRKAKKTVVIPAKPKKVKVVIEEAEAPVKKTVAKKAPAKKAVAKEVVAKESADEKVVAKKAPAKKKAPAAKTTKAEKE